MKKPILKGALTKLSAALLLVIQSPNILADVSQVAEIFASNSEKPIALLSIVASVGVIWGAIRRAFNYFGK